MNLLSIIQSFFLRYPLKEMNTCWVAYSGGLDSQVLLDLCRRLRSIQTFHLRAIHIHHGLNAKADDWSLHCKNYCQQHQIDYFSHRLTIQLNSGESLEEVARIKRYDFFRECLAAGDLLLTAHHQDDQAETVLLQLLRGAGPKGLAAMPEIISFGLGAHARPLLEVSRRDLTAYAKEHQLPWIEDDSNQNLKFARNYIRHELLPVIMQRWPGAMDTITRSAKHCRESQALLEEFSLSYFKHHKHLSIKKLQAFSPARQRLLLRAWIAAENLPLPSTKKLVEIQMQMLNAASDKMPMVQFGKAVIRRYRDKLYLMPSANKSGNDLPDLVWDLQAPLTCAHGTLHAEPSNGQGLKINTLVTVKFRQKKKMVALPNRGRHDLKKLFQEWSVPPWERSHLPLLFVNDQLIAVPGYFIAKDYLAAAHEMGYELRWQELHEG